MKNSLCLDEKANQSQNFSYPNNIKEINNENIPLTNKDIKQKIVNNTSSKKNIENDYLNNNENLTNNIIIKSDYNDSTKGDIQKNNLKIMNIFEYQYTGNCFYEKLKNENKKLIETMKNMEERYQKEIKYLKEDKKILKQKIEFLNQKIKNIFDNEKFQEENLDNKTPEIKAKSNVINEFQKILEYREKEIDVYKSKIQQYKNDMIFLVEDFEKKKNQLEKTIPQLNIKINKLEHDYKEIKILLENEKNKNIINNIIINEKNGELKYFNKIFKKININNEKIIKNDIASQLNINVEKDMNNESKYNNNKYGQVGIINTGFNCYMNSVIQILKNIKIFWINILSYDKDDIITNSLRKLLNNLYYSNSKYISIYEFKKDFGTVYNKFADDKENDSTLFLVYLLQHLNKACMQPNKHVSSIYLFKDLKLSLSEENSLEKFLNKYENNNNSFINNIFYGYQMDKLVCTKCEYSQASFQSFNVLYLSLITENIKVKSLEETLNSYLITKDKHGTNGFECPNCKGYFLSHSTSIIKLPQILIICLKRVGEDTIYYNDIEIPKILKSKWIDKLSLHNNKEYELIGFIKHFGNEKSGHNIAFSKNIFDNKWYCFDDVNVIVQKEFPSTNKSFLLFYQIINN